MKEHDDVIWHRACIAHAPLSLILKGHEEELDEGVHSVLGKGNGVQRSPQGDSTGCMRVALNPWN